MGAEGGPLPAQPPRTCPALLPVMVRFRMTTRSPSEPKAPAPCGDERQTHTQAGQPAIGQGFAERAARGRRKG